MVDVAGAGGEMVERETEPGKRYILVSTGGTIEKTYDALSGLLDNRVSVLDMMLAQLQLRGGVLSRMQLMNKDSLRMSGEDHELIAHTVGELLETYDGVIVLHGTDTLEKSGARCEALLDSPSGPVVFTGAMRPYELRSSDALQNLTEALIAVQLLTPGVYVVMHNQVLKFPGVYKNREQLCFERQDRSLKPPTS